MGQSRSVRRRKHKRKKRLEERALRFHQANDTLSEAATLLNSVRWENPNAFWTSVGLLMEVWRTDANFWASQLGSENGEIARVWDKNILLKRIQFIISLVFSKDADEDEKEKKLMIAELQELLRRAFSGQQPYCPKQLNSSRRHRIRL